MKMWLTGSARRKVLGISLAAVIFASVMVTKNDQDNTASASVEAEPSSPQHSRDANAAPTAELDLDRLNRNSPPSQPKAPPLPFTYLGKMIDGESTITFILRGDKSYSIRAGDIIDNVYKVKHITDHSIVFVYLPLKSRQTLMVAGAQ